MDEALKLLLTTLSTIITILLTLVTNGVRVIYNKQKDHEVTLSDMQHSLDEVVAWKTQVQREEIDSKNQEIVQLKQQVKELTK